jgi:hypothetical protein
LAPQFKYANYVDSDVAGGHAQNELIRGEMQFINFVDWRQSDYTAADNFID